MLTRLRGFLPQLMLGGVVFLLSGCFRCGCGPPEPDPDPDPCEGVTCAGSSTCNPASGECEPVDCTPGRTRCSPTEPNGLERCNAIGNGWTRVGACEPASVCVEGPTGARCDPPSCEPGASQCVPDGTISYCMVGVWEDPVDCPSGWACDFLMGSSCVPTVCGPGTMFCDQNVDAVRMCNGLGTDSTLVETCTPEEICNAGLCLSLCSLAEMAPGRVGCTFYALDTNNTSHDDPLDFAIYVTNPDQTLTADVSVETRSPSGVWTPVSGGLVAPMTALGMTLEDRHAEGSAVEPALAYRITASIPVEVTQFNAPGPAGSPVSSGATSLNARIAHGTTYRALGLPASEGDDAAWPFGGEMHASGVAVVALEDGTAVTFTSSTNTAPGIGLPALGPGDMNTVMLNEGDVWQIESAAVGDDITGSLIVATSDVAVFVYHECATIDPGSCDHFEEELPPVPAFAPTYVAARAEGTGSAFWRILGLMDGTDVTFEYSGTVGGLPVAASGDSVSLDDGEVLDLLVDGDFVCSGTGPFLLGQWTTAEPSMVLAAPSDAWRAWGRFVLPPGYTGGMTISAAYSVEPISIDGTPPGGASQMIGTFYEVLTADVSPGLHVVLGISVSETVPFSLVVAGESGTAHFAFDATSGFQL